MLERLFIQIFFFFYRNSFFSVLSVAFSPSVLSSNSNSFVFKTMSFFSSSTAFFLSTVETRYKFNQTEPPTPLPPPGARFRLVFLVSCVNP